MTSSLQHNFTFLGSSWEEPTSLLPIPGRREGVEHSKLAYSICCVFSEVCHRFESVAADDFLFDLIELPDQ